MKPEGRDCETTYIVQYHLSILRARQWSRILHVSSNRSWQKNPQDIFGLERRQGKSRPSQLSLRSQRYTHETVHRNLHPDI